MTPMRRRCVRAGAVAGIAGATTVGLITGANALWSMNDSVTIPAFKVGGVAFAAEPNDADASTTLEYSSGGESVSVTLPGSKVAEVLGQTGLNPPPVIWTFDVTGWGDGITGLVYDVNVTQQVNKDGTTFDLKSGVGEDSTLLHFSTLKVYPASVSGDCGDVPETSEPAQGQVQQNVYVFDGDGHVLQAPGAKADPRTTQVWCAALDFINAPDGEYVNEAQASGTNAAKGTTSSAIDSWQSAVAFPPSLPSIGDYYNKAFAQGLAEDKTLARAEDDWGAAIYPDPSNEPDVTITIDPAVTNQNPGVEQPSDHFALTTPAP